MAAVAERSIGIGFDSDEVAFALHLTRRGAQTRSPSPKTCSAAYPQCGRH
jgi:hypothetical protein